MPRIVSVWLPRWPIRRFLAAPSLPSPACGGGKGWGPVDSDRPFVLTVEAAGGPRIAALNEAAEAEGLAVRDLLADARAKVTTLQVRPAEPAADDAALRRLALWATRYTPTVSPWGEENGADGFFLDVAGASHLFGGEEMLLADLISRLDRFGLPARLAIADTAGAAWALARFHPNDVVILPSGREAEALALLPVAALRLTLDTCATLRRLGFKRIGALIDKPRAPFAVRFESELLTRLDQALGRAAEPLALIAPPPVYHSLRYLLEPIFSQDAIVAVATRLMKDLVHALVRDGAGAGALRLALYRVDGEVTTLDIGLTMPTRDTAHVARLFDLKLERIAEAVEFGFGFEALGLAATIVEPIEPAQTDLAPAADGQNAEACAALVDRLQQRLGPRSVRRIAPVASYLPERAETAVTGAVQAWPAPQAARPLFLLPHAERADVLALVPEGPPQRFRWRGVMHDVAHAQGPERIASEWWRSLQPTRDYYLVEDEDGRRFWLYREGLYERETNAPRWFVQGLFA
jgi:protein ImuB